MTKIAFTTLGCKTNHYDTDAMADACRRAGHDVVSPLSDADVHVVNTCTVTAAADAQGRNLIRRVIRKNPAGVVVVCGCSSQVDADRYRNIEGVDYVLGVRAAEKLIPLLCKEGKGEVDLPHPTSPYKGEGQQPRARAFLKIQDGCNNSCSYCIVPFARGPSVSVPADEVVCRAKEMAGCGYREIILTGVHIGRYGRDLTSPATLSEVANRILHETSDIRIRISSLDPDELDDDLCRMFSNPRICRHIHLSLQSGSDNVLRMMNRKKGVKKYREIICALAQKIPGIAIGADIITGFPGETDADFNETLGYLDDAPFAYLHVFPYSARGGTSAASMPDQLPFAVRKSRAKRLLKISEKMREAFCAGQAGAKLDVIIVSRGANRNGLMKGISDNYIPVFIKGSLLKYGEKYEIEVVKTERDSVYGNLT